MIAAGFGAPPSSISSRWNSAVGALPIATTAPASRSPQSSIAAAERVVPSFSASAGTRGSRSVQITALLAGSRARVMPCATISASQRIGARPRVRRALRHEAGPRIRCAPAACDQPAGMDHADRDLGLVRGEAREVGFGADDGERALQ